MIRAYVTDDHMALGVNISIVVVNEQGRPTLLYRARNADGIGGTFDVTEIDPHGVYAPTMTLGHEVARALLDALLRHYGGRVDKLTAAVIGLAERLAEPPADTRFHAASS